VGPVKDGQIYLIGSQAGYTNILIFNQVGDLLRQLDVTVNTDTSQIQDRLKREFKDMNVSVDTVGDQVFLNGTVPDAQTAATIKDCAMRFSEGDETVVNNLEVSGNQQVMIHVKVVEVSRNILNELGIETDITNLNSGNFTAANSVGGAGN